MHYWQYPFYSVQRRPTRTSPLTISDQSDGTPTASASLLYPIPPPLLSYQLEQYIISIFWVPSLDEINFIDSTEDEIIQTHIQHCYSWSFLHYTYTPHFLFQTIFFQRINNINWVSEWKKRGHMVVVITIMEGGDDLGILVVDSCFCSCTVCSLPSSFHL